MCDIVYLNPSGNKTALFNNCTYNEAIARSNDVILSGFAEQCAIKSEPVNGGDCRIEMLGGEFCGNAVRAYGYWFYKYEYRGGSPIGNIKVEISGNDNPLNVSVNLNDRTAFVDMPVLDLGEIDVLNIDFDNSTFNLPLVHMPGIDHIIVEVNKYKNLIKEFRCNFKKSEYIKEFISLITTNKKLSSSEAIGIMFTNKDKLIPYVEVTSLNTKVWESSCGSGTTAYFIYLLDTVKKSGNYDIETSMPLIHCDCTADGLYNYEKKIKEPGGEIIMRGIAKHQDIIKISMGGEIIIN